MATAPYGVRLLLGAAVTAIEETRKLPQTILMYPMTVASTLAQMVMKVQQDLADIAIRGDAALENFFPPKDEKPDWATFDEDLPDEPDRTETNGGRRTEGRFALYSVNGNGDGQPAPGPAQKPAKKGAKKATAKASAESPARPSTEASGESSAAAPPIVAELDYASLTLAQLRARMTSLSVADLRVLLAYEEAGKARAPFLTLLATRITRATAK